MNMEAMEQLMEAADGMSVTLHRAFDVLPRSERSA